MNGIINLLKPPGLSSAQAVSFVKRLTGQKVGHAGTLDPEACGVLPIMIGKATTLFDYIAEHQKVYVAEIAFGTATDTQDATGRVIGRGEDFPDAEALRRSFERFQGTVMQVPPAFSALKREGKALYELAREGTPVALAARPVQIAQITLMSERPGNVFLMRIHCGKGTYIRTLCHDIGAFLGCPAHMRSLIREKTGPFEIQDAITMEELETAWKGGEQPGKWLLGMEETVSHLPKLHLKDALWKPCINGVALEPEAAEGGGTLPEQQPAAMYCRGRLIGLYQKENGKLKLKTMLIDPQLLREEGRMPGL